MAVEGAGLQDFSAVYVLQPVAAADWLVVAPVVWCILMGAVLLMLRKRTDLQPLIAIPALVVLALMTLGLLAHVLTSGTVTMTMGRWLPPFGISFTADLLGAFFAATSSLVALATGIYGRSDVDDSGRRYGFYPFLMLMMAGIIGAFLTGDIFNLYVWFEVLLISSFGLLVLGSERLQLDGGIKYAFLNLIATTLFLVATGYLYGLFGTLNMADIAVKASELRGTAPLMTLVALYLLAFAMKAAAFPVNFWLPASYHTPRLAVGGIFAGLLTKVGVYALLRILGMLFPVEREELSFIIAVAAALTMVLGVLGAMAQNDMRRAMGYLVISGIGMMMAGLALGSPAGLSGAIFYAAHSMVVMTALYFAVGIGAQLGGDFRLTASGGLYARSAAISALTLMLFFSVAGLPPFSGFWPKVMLVKASLDIGAWWLAAAMLLTGFLTTITVARIWVLAYWRPAKSEAEETAIVAPPAVGAVVALVGLVALTTAAGVWPEPLVVLAQDAARGLIDPSSYILSVFPGEAAQ
ncbi:Na+/H+ antiporter subunit D [Hoeflea sp. G2-23]|uniref:Na+/H+ antiporter subunit D n=1 Tax=Hoeflea algicola TaxID=2983763 RepID=A0ABT3Z4R4_9HYPH|nr:Na+/H+ antiporter subunit D [Hoeflea algicola]MCY0146301.1 Na+/H+ antiporter subunit D [Hoeflea algicola]